MEPNWFILNAKIMINVPARKLCRLKKNSQLNDESTSSDNVETALKKWSKMQIESTLRYIATSFRRQLSDAEST